MRDTRMPVVAFSGDADYDTLWSVLNGWYVRIERHGADPIEGKVEWKVSELTIHEIDDNGVIITPHHYGAEHVDSFSDVITAIEVL